MLVTKASPSHASRLAPSRERRTPRPCLPENASPDQNWGALASPPASPRASKASAFHSYEYQWKHKIISNLLIATKHVLVIKPFSKFNEYSPREKNSPNRKVYLYWKDYHPQVKHGIFQTGTSDRTFWEREGHLKLKRGSNLDLPLMWTSSFLFEEQAYRSKTT